MSTKELLLIISMATTLFTGCDPSPEDRCENIFRALEYLHTRHVRASRELNTKLLINAQIQLLRQHQADIPSPFPESMKSQCSATYQALRKKSGSYNFSTMAREIVNNYVRQLDPHSAAVTRAESLYDGSFHNGYGFAIERSDEQDRTEIVDVIAGSPAHKAGLQEGMLIWSINGVIIREMSMSEIIAMIDSQGTDRLTLGIMPRQLDRAFHELTLTRDEFRASPIKFNTFLQGTVGYLKIRTFVGAEPMFTETLRTLSSAKAMILDLRDLPGGSIRDAADIADWFVPHMATFVGLLGRNEVQINAVEMNNAGSVWDGPLVVLVNGSTKSAGEILAAALQDYGAIVVGTRTFGKGTRQTFLPLDDYKLEGGVYLTDAFTIRPSGRVLQFHGVLPNVLLYSSESPRRESDYPKALTPPEDQIPLQGYDPSLLPVRSLAFRKRLDGLQIELQRQANSGALGASEEDQQLEAARRVALFLIDELSAHH